MATVEEILASLAQLDALPGVGVDVESLERWHKPDVRLFTEKEREYCLSVANPAESFAGRWCAKEAVVKAVSRFADLSVRDVEILVQDNGAPKVQLGRVERARLLQVAVSITHTDSVAVAVAVAWEPNPRSADSAS